MVYVYSRSKWQSPFPIMLDGATTHNKSAGCAFGVHMYARNATVKRKLRRKGKPSRTISRVADTHLRAGARTTTNAAPSAHGPTSADRRRQPNEDPHRTSDEAQKQASRPYIPILVVDPTLTTLIDCRSVVCTFWRTGGKHRIFLQRTREGEWRSIGGGE